MGVNLMFEAGRLAERRGWSSAEVVEADAVAAVPPGRGEVIVVAPEGAFSVQHAREVAALSASGKEVAVVTTVAPPEAVSAWLPEGCIYLAGETLDTAWSVSDGLVTLTPEGDDIGALWDEMILEGVSTEHARNLARAIAQVKVGVAWDRPVFAPVTRLCPQGIVNQDGYYGRTPIRGLRAAEYLRFEDDEVTTMWATDSNPLHILQWTNQAYESFDAVLTLNVSLDDSPALLVCGPRFGNQQDYDFSCCIVREREGAWLGPGRGAFELTRLQARPRTRQDNLAPLPGWLNAFPSDSRDVVLKLLDAWASGFFRGAINGGLDWFCRHGKNLDVALQTDWATLIDELEQVGRT